MGVRQGLTDHRLGRWQKRHGQLEEEGPVSAADSSRAAAAAELAMLRQLQSQPRRSGRFLRQLREKLPG